MSEVKKYLSNGAISPLWAEIQYQKACDEHEVEMARRIAEAQSSVAANNNNIITSDTIRDIIENAMENISEDDSDDYYDESDYCVKDELEDMLQFLKDHSSDKQEYEMAKFVVSNYRK